MFVFTFFDICTFVICIDNETGGNTLTLLYRVLINRGWLGMKHQDMLLFSKLFLFKLMR